MQQVTNSRPLRTRFAPSPTGIMHIGNLRAAVLSYLWSVKNSGEFILRIDDTDRDRSREDLKQYIEEDLKWLGIKWDWIFRQSDRQELYQEVLQKCIDNGLVYEVYETEEELEQIRKELAKKRLPPIYKKSGDCKHIAERERYWRFDLNNQIIRFEDKIKKSIEIDLRNTSDPVVCKANGDFTYIFASVVDDLECGISTIIRASDHISNTAVQLMMMRKMIETGIFKDAVEPEFAHYALFMHESKEKLSKRNKSMSINELKSMPPLAIAHFLYAIGNNLKVQPEKSMFDLAKSFDFCNYTSSNTIEFSQKQLLSWEKKIISCMDSSEIKAWAGISFGKSWDLLKSCIDNQQDLLYWKEVIEQKKAFCVLSEGDDLLKLYKLTSKKSILELLQQIAAEKKMSDVSKLKLLLVRQALTGRNFGPKLGDLLQIIADEIVDFRLQNYKNIDLRFHNSLSGQIEVFKAIDPFKVKIYACGPTLYEVPHMGNIRAFTVFDLAYRFLRFRYKDVVYVRNITDIDDKIINRAQEMKISPSELVEQIYPRFKQQMQDLNILEPTIEPRVTKFLPQIIDCIQQMLEKNCAYRADDGIYFKIEEVKNYNLFRICGESESDFVLWKFRKESEVGWESPWGWGRPGWHIECTAMSLATIGLPFDLHCGGKDLIFPHHTNECAQACGMGFEKTANYWLHNNFINIDKCKMSKSLRNSVYLAEISKHPMVIRTALLMSHYRQELPWCDNLLAEASIIYNKWRRQLGKMLAKENWTFTNATSGYPLVEIMEILALDFNTPLVLKKLDAAFSEANAADLLASFDLLGISFDFAYLRDRTVQNLVDQRQIARNEKNFQKADEIRRELDKLGVELEECKENVCWYVRV